MTRFGPAIAAILLTIAPALALDRQPAMQRFGFDRLAENV